MGKLIFICAKWLAVVVVLIIATVYDQIKPVLMIISIFMCVTMLNDELNRMTKDLEKKLKSLTKKELTNDDGDGESIH